MNFFRILDKKEYELKDHLGNVRVAIGDMKLPENEATSTRGVPPFVTDEKAVNDYYPFGMTIADRSWQSTDYRYGYNMQEKSTEIDPFGNHNTAEFWEYDTRSGRRWNTDPVVKEFESPYATFAGNPIALSDLSGDDAGNGENDTPLAPEAKNNPVEEGNSGGFWSSISSGLKSIGDGLTRFIGAFLPKSTSASTSIIVGPVINNVNIIDNPHDKKNMGTIIEENYVETGKTTIEFSLEALIFVNSFTPYAPATDAMSIGLNLKSKYFDVSPSQGYYGLALAPFAYTKGVLRPFGYAWHHIVAHSHSNGFAKASVKILKKYGIWIDGVDNGVLLIRNKNFVELGETAIHSKIHTSKYLETVYQRLNEAKSKDEAIKILKQIGDELEKNVFPY